MGGSRVKSSPLLSAQLVEFQERCHQFYTCLSFATKGLNIVAKRLQSQIDPHKEVFIGIGDEPRIVCKIRMGDAMTFSEENGVFEDLLAKSLIVSIYTEWDEVFRHKIATEMGASAKDISSDLMGDLRLVRHWVVHNKSRIDEKCKKIKVLGWSLVEGNELKLSEEMFGGIIERTNVMSILITRPNKANEPKADLRVRGLDWALRVTRPPTKKHDS